ncbi:MAG: hypothetical protein ACYC91_13080 [Solirubrobacteraceae bacterium]
MRHVTTRTAGFVIVLAGVWGALIPFVGPYFHFALGLDRTWNWSNERFWLDVLPGIAAVLGGLVLLRAGPRLSGRLGALIALAAGVWFAIGPDLSHLWHVGGAAGLPHGSKGKAALELLTFHTGLGALITALAAYSLPGVLRVHRDTEIASPGAGVGASRGDRHAPVAERGGVAEPGGVAAHGGAAEPGGASGGEENPAGGRAADGAEPAVTSTQAQRRV